MRKTKQMSIDVSDYSIIKEGEAEILMHAKNEVFYNKTQVLKSSPSLFSLAIFVLYFFWVSSTVTGLNF